MNNRTLVIVSSWKRDKGNGGLCVYELDDAGALNLLSVTDTDIRFNYVYIDKDKSLVYALDETDKHPEQRAGGGGQIYVYKLNRETGELTFMQRVPTWCPNPTWLSIEPEKKYAVVSNHGSKSVATRIKQNENGEYELDIVTDDSVIELFEVNEDGTLGKMLDVVKHYGSGPEARQASPRPHCAVMSPDGKLFCVCDKGNDTVRMYSIDKKERKLALPGGFYKCPTASLPRYCVFHPSKPYMFHNNENCYDLCSYSYDTDGKLELIGKTSVVPEGFACDKPKQEQQGLTINPSGKVIYDIVRGPDCISVLSVNEDDGTTELKQNVSVDDPWPRGNAITEDGRFLIVCGLIGGRIFVYSLNADGMIEKLCSVSEQSCAAYVSTWMF